MKSFLKNSYGSIAPVIIFIIVIVIVGLLFGVFGLIITPIATDITAMDRIMSMAWPGAILFIVIFSISWLFMRAQKQNGGFEY